MYKVVNEVFYGFYDFNLALTNTTIVGKIESSSEVEAKNIVESTVKEIFKSVKTEGKFTNAKVLVSISEIEPDIFSI